MYVCIYFDKCIFYVTGTLLSTLEILTYLKHIVSLREVLLSVHFIDKENEAQRINLLKVIQVVSGKAGIWT